LPLRDGLVAVTVGDAAMAANHCAEKERDQHPSEKLKLEHDGYPAKLALGRVDSSRGSKFK
jgi:hypothetical protein